jgi:thiamine pyrophosphate-dependent acetolactate synthase large subunit-like protein
MNEQVEVSDAGMVLRVLEGEGVEICFGNPGSVIPPLYDVDLYRTLVLDVQVARTRGAPTYDDAGLRCGGRS